MRSSFQPLAGPRSQLLALLAGLMTAPTLYGAHPLITEDTATQGRGNFQFELTNEHGVIRELGSEQQVVLTSGVLTYGVTDAADVILTVPYLRLGASALTGTPTESGFTDAGLDMKWRFYEKDRFSLALKPGLIFPTGDESHNLGSGRTGWSTYVAASYQPGPWNLLLHVGHLHHNNAAGERRDIWHASAAVIRNIGEVLQLVVDAGVDTNTDRSTNSNPSFLTGGAIWSVRQNIDLDLGFRLGSTDTQRLRTLLAGVALRW
jgi:hypothetical protein